MSKEILTNIENSTLKDDYSGKQLNGKIQLASTRGYLSDKERPQQDAVGSIIKNETCYLNIVADGMGGSGKGEKASMKLVDDIINWFDKLPEETIINTELISELLQAQIDKTNDELYKLYDGKALTTFVLSITTNEITIIANLGDSTAYEYNEEEGYVEKITPLDSWASSEEWYEDIRNSLYGHVVTAGVGDYFKDKIHINLVDNCGQKIILSSDGVTDLVNEETFTSYFTSDVSVDKIIEDALYNPDVEYLEKKEDNISAIIVNLPATTKKIKHKKIKQKNNT